MGRIVQRQIRRRGFAGKVFKWMFIGFNVLMAVWLISALAGLGEGAAGRQMTDAEAIGYGAGGAIVMGTILMLWALGDVILGMLTYFTRGPVEIVTEEVA